jgi:Flp pilus assembly pilin Flp
MSDLIRRKLLKRLVTEEDGQTLVENALMIALIALVILSLVNAVGSK